MRRGYVAGENRFDIYETHPGWHGVWDRMKKGHYPYEFSSRDEALSEARRMLVEAATGKMVLELIEDDDKVTGAAK